MNIGWKSAVSTSQMLQQSFFTLWWGVLRVESGSSGVEVRHTVLMVGSGLPWGYIIYKISRRCVCVCEWLLRPRPAVACRRALWLQAAAAQTLTSGCTSPLWLASFRQMSQQEAGGNPTTSQGCVKKDLFPSTGGLHPSRFSWETSKV